MKPEFKLHYSLVHGRTSPGQEPFDPWPLVAAFSVVVVVVAGLYAFATKFDKSHRDCLTIILVSHILGFINIYSLPIFSKIDVQPL